MPERIIVAASLMALSVLGVHHKPAEAAPISTRGAVADSQSMAEPVGGCRDCKGARTPKQRGSVEGYRRQPKVRGWSRSVPNYVTRPSVGGSARWDSDYRFGASSWGDQRAWDYYGRF